MSKISLIDSTWTCGCGSLNAGYRKTCGGCEEREIKKNRTPKKDLLSILNLLKEDFEMLEDGRWDLAYSDGSEIQASLKNIEKAIKILKTQIHAK